MKSKNNTYTQWLIKHKYSPRIVRRYSRSALNYSDWLTARKIPVQQAQYTDLINYIGHLQEQQLTKNILNENLRGIRQYYIFLELPNIAYNVMIRGVQKKALLFLTEEELHTIYEQYTGNIPHSYTTHSNKLLLGLFIYQAIALHDILNLKLQDVNLEKGTLYIPAGKRRFNSRIVKLEAHQIIQIHSYITQHRQNINCSSSPKVL